MDTRQRDESEVVKRIGILMKLGDAFPQVAVEASTYKLYAEELRRFDAADIEAAVKLAVAELDRFPSLAQILKRVKQRSTTAAGGWGKARQHITSAIEAHLTAAERRFLSELNNLWWRIDRQAATPEECERFGLDVFGESLYHWLPSPERVWGSAQSAHNYVAAIRSKNGEVQPAMEVM
jgi:hypothetical protein